MKTAMLASLFVLSCGALPALAEDAPKKPAHPKITWEQHFATANTAHDGHLTIEQARTGYQSLFKHFAEIDVGGNGLCVPRSAVVGVARAGAGCDVACRPESLTVNSGSGASTGSGAAFAARVAALHRLGPMLKVTFDTVHGPLTGLMMANAPEGGLAENQSVQLSIAADSLTVFAQA